MALETTFRELFRQLTSLKGSLDALRCLLPDDPQNVEVALVQHRRESVDSVCGWLDDCLEHCQAAQTALKQPGEMNRVRSDVALCQASFDEAERTSSIELFSYDKLREVVQLGARRKGVWRIWSQNVKRDLSGFRYELDLTRKALTSCWQALAELAGTTNISVQATNVGQQITARRSELRDYETEGVT